MKLKLRVPKVLLVAVVLLALVADSVSAGSRIRRKPMRRCCPQPVANVPGCCPQRCVPDDMSLLRKICLQELIATIGNGNCIWFGKVCYNNDSISVMADCYSVPGQVCNDCSVQGRRKTVPVNFRVIESSTGDEFYANDTARQPLWVTPAEAAGATGSNGWTLSAPTYVTVPHGATTYYFALYHAEKAGSESQDFGVRISSEGLGAATLSDTDNVVPLDAPETGGVREVVIISDSVPYHVHLASDGDSGTNDEVW
jgi:hypothetical protein